MRSMTVEIGGREFELAASFGAAAEIAKRVGDPLMIVREATLEAMMLRAGQTHAPKWMPTVENVPVILWVGAGGPAGKIKLAEMQEAVFDHGFVEAKELALEYMAMLVTPRGQEKSDDAERKPDAGE